MFGWQFRSYIDAGIIGAVLSSPLFNALGYYGIYAIHTSCITLSLVYTTFIVRNYPVNYKRQKMEMRKGKTEDETSWLRSKVLNPLRDLFGTLSRKRPHNMRTLLLVNFFAMGMYYTTQDV